MSSRRRTLTVICVVFFGLDLFRLAFACGPFPAKAAFWHTRLPGASLDAFLAGELGIHEPRFRHAYHVVAYRYLSGLGLDAVSREAVKGYWEETSAGSTRDLDLPDELTRGLDVYKEIEQTENGYVFTTFFQNCLPDALATAERTYADRLQRLGEEESRRWVEAQAQVFAFCSGEGAIPEPLPATASALARADRDYQIAAAYFYAGNFEESRRRFRAIAEDRASPWNALSRYLVARTLVRQWLLETDAREDALRAEASLRELLSDHEMAALHPAAERLLGFVSARIHPEEKRRELAERLTRSQLTTPVRQDLIDYIWLTEREFEREMPAAASPGDDMTEWLRALWGENAAGATLSLERWREKRTLPWLVLALMHAEGNAGTEALLGASSVIEKDSPAYATVTYHRARLLLKLGREDEARSLLDAALEDETLALTLSDRNRLLALRVTGSRDLDELLRFSQMVPVEVGFDDGTSLYAGGGDALEAYRDGRALFDERAARILNRFFTPRLLLQAIETGLLAPDLARQLAVAAWTRAVLLGEPSVAMELAPVLSRLEPALASELHAYRAAAAGDAREFAAAFSMLKFPGLSPLVEAELGRIEPIGAIDSFRHNWWCGWPSPDGTEGELEPSFLTSEEKEAARSMNERVSGLEPGPTHLGRQVLAWVRSHPNDERAPEALHLVVRSTRYGCRYAEGDVTDFGEVSRGAFQELHRRYPKSSWAEKTKYWFR